MTEAEIKAQQSQERAQCLNAVLESPAPKKLIVAGAGTGKTFTFSKLLAQSQGGTNLALTFIRKLVADMEASLGHLAEVKTFHAFCKKILHQQNGQIELAPYLTKVIEKDADLLGKHLADFDAKLRNLEEGCAEISFYLKRGDYYAVVGFDDSVYRLYKAIQADPTIVPQYDQIVVDEFQDFNPLEVAFIDELSKHGNVLIVGDDDQAVYNDRSASPDHLRALYQSGEFEKFELPFCSRCTKVVVDAVKSIIQRAQQTGHFKGRVAKRYECYWEDKAADSLKYPKIVVANLTTGSVIPKYIGREIAQIDPSDIKESHDKAYPTVLIVGPRQYLREVEKQLRSIHPQLSYTASSESDYGLCEAYEFISRDPRSNFGWRILMERMLEVGTQRRVLAATEDGTALVDLLDQGFVARHLAAVQAVKGLQDEQMTPAAAEDVLNNSVGPEAQVVLKHFLAEETEDEPPTDPTKPSILLTSFKGCKGLSAGHVFIVGVHVDAMPRDANNITDVEISQFIVAMTRTRKQCHILSNNWLVAPVDKNKQFLPRFRKSPFISWIAPNLVNDCGELKAKDFK
jgi:superfamily I DNA/RNA helicase